MEGENPLPAPPQRAPPNSAAPWRCRSNGGVAGDLEPNRNRCNNLKIREYFHFCIENVGQNGTVLWDSRDESPYHLSNESEVSDRRYQYTPREALRRSLVSKIAAAEVTETTAGSDGFVQNENFIPVIGSGAMRTFSTKYAIDSSAKALERRHIGRPLGAFTFS